MKLCKVDWNVWKVVTFSKKQCERRGLVVSIQTWSGRVIVFLAANYCIGHQKIYHSFESMHFYSHFDITNSRTKPHTHLHVSTAVALNMTTIFLFCNQTCQSLNFSKESQQMALVVCQCLYLSKYCYPAIGKVDEMEKAWHVPG